MYMSVSLNRKITLTVKQIIKPGIVFNYFGGRLQLPSKVKFPLEINKNPNFFILEMDSH